MTGSLTLVRVKTGLDSTMPEGARDLRKDDSSSADCLKASCSLAFAAFALASSEAGMSCPDLSRSFNPGLGAFGVLAKPLLFMEGWRVLWVNRLGYTYKPIGYPDIAWLYFLQLTSRRTLPVS